MKKLPLSVQTLYADLVQSLSFAPTVPGSVYRQNKAGGAYLYVKEKHGATRVQRYLGPASDPNVLSHVEDIRRAEEEAKLRRRTVSMLKRAGVPAPLAATGQILEAIAHAGLFHNGLVLVGTAAYQIYPPIVGAVLSEAWSTTADVDLAVVSRTISNSRGDPLLDILRRAEPRFRPQIGLDPRAPPKRFRSSQGLDVDVIAPYRSRRDEERPPVIAGLQCSAEPLRYLEYLISDPVMAVALYGAGVRVMVPQPARYAVHKLVVAQLRTVDRVKRAKDLHQARELIEALDFQDPHTVAEAMQDARRRGPKWRAHIDASLKEIGRETTG